MPGTSYVLVASNHTIIVNLLYTVLTLQECRCQVLDTVVAAEIPIAGNIGGGYHSDLTVLARRHSLLHRAASQSFVDHRL